MQSKPSRTEQNYLNFWTQFQRYTQTKIHDLPSPAPDITNYLDFRKVLPKSYLGITFNMKENYISCELLIRKDRELFTTLRDNAELIQKTLKPNSLNKDWLWDDSAEIQFKIKLISIQTSPIDLSNSSQVSLFNEWFLTHLMLFKSFFEIEISRSSKGTNRFRFNEFKSNSENKYYIEKSLIKEITDDIHIANTVKKQLIDARIGQGKFREKLLEYWNGRCAVENCDFVPILIASHIKPWSVSTNRDRLDVYNGLLLSANLDILFGGGYISFRDDGPMIISGNLPVKDRTFLGCSKEKEIKLMAKHAPFMQYHRENIFEK